MRKRERDREQREAKKQARDKYIYIKSDNPEKQINKPEK